MATYGGPADGMKNEYSNIEEKPVDPESTRVDPQRLGTGVSRGVQYLGSGNVFSDAGNQRIVVSDGKNERIFIGKLPDGSFGWAISKEGFNVSDAFS